ncbi:MAG TPA: glycosyltransferase [Pyrinomonadaceae bacterium]|nr:glycosyltransferase [Pyrinomonadaceae bacterium]
MSNPKASICIPSYNHARFLPAAIESALAQTFTDFEIVIVDDGSTDDSLAIAQKYSAQYPSKIRVYTHPAEPHRGLQETVNFGARMARGEYYSGLPSDDVLHPEKLRKQVEFLDSHPEIGWVYSDADYIGDDGQPINNLGIFADITRAPDPLTSLIEQNVIPGMTVLARLECIRKVGDHEPAIAFSDWEYWVRMLGLYNVAFLDESTVSYRVHSYNTSFGADDDVCIQRCLEVLKSLRRKAPVSQGRLASPRIQAFLDLQLGYYEFLAGNSKQARQHFRSAFKVDQTLARDPAYVANWMKRRTSNVVFTFHRRIFFEKLLGENIVGGLVQFKRALLQKTTNL